MKGCEYIPTGLKIALFIENITNYRKLNNNTFKNYLSTELQSRFDSTDMSNIFNEYG